MVTRRVIRGVLGNFLGTYMSRYSDYNGYWLFGYLVGALGTLRIDLLAPAMTDSASPSSVAGRLAGERFADQARKASLARSQIREAWLLIQRQPGSIMGSVNSHPCSGYKVSFSAGAVMEDGRRYGCERVVFIAEHNPAHELRRAVQTDESDAAAKRPPN
jgi:hypothetical protein